MKKNFNYIYLCGSLQTAAAAAVDGDCDCGDVSTRCSRCVVYWISPPKRSFTVLIAITREKLLDAYIYIYIYECNGLQLFTNLFDLQRCSENGNSFCHLHWCCAVPRWSQDKTWILLDSIRDACLPFI